MEMPRFSGYGQFPKVVVINYSLTTNESEFQLLHILSTFNIESLFSF